jgi:hypothetical protein
MEPSNTPNTPNNTVADPPKSTEEDNSILQKGF